MSASKKKASPSRASAVKKKSKVTKPKKVEKKASPPKEKPKKAAPKAKKVVKKEAPPPKAVVKAEPVKLGPPPMAMVTTRRADAGAPHERSARGFSFGELASAGVPLSTAKRQDLSIDLRRRSVVDKNVEMLKGWLKSSAKTK